MKDMKLKDKIFEESKKGNVCFNTIEGLVSCPIDQFIQQPVDGLLYDLNRDAATILTLMDDQKWVNDYAVNRVITKLHEDREKLMQLLETRVRGLFFLQSLKVPTGEEIEENWKNFKKANNL